MLTLYMALYSRLGASEVSKLALNRNGTHSQVNTNAHSKNARNYAKQFYVTAILYVPTHTTLNIRNENADDPKQTRIGFSALANNKHFFANNEKLMTHYYIAGME